ncbi:hypothetical protein OAM53_00725 [Candidatus Thioglobus sp.]|nr:hypothetical protein [Candidatus Thioglobus sp.]
MKKLLILLALLNGFANAEIIELDCKHRAEWDNREYDVEEKFTIDAKSKRMYQGEVVYILETQPHFYIAYNMVFFDNNELLLTEKQIYPRSYWSYKINRENLNYWQYGHDSPTRLLNDSKCTIINRDNII